MEKEIKNSFSRYSTDFPDKVPYCSPKLGGEEDLFPKTIKFPSVFRADISRLTKKRAVETDMHRPAQTHLATILLSWLWSERHKGEPGLGNYQIWPEFLVGKCCRRKTFQKGHWWGLNRLYEWYSLCCVNSCLPAIHYWWDARDWDEKGRSRQWTTALDAFYSTFPVSSCSPCLVSLALLPSDATPPHLPASNQDIVVCCSSSCKASRGSKITHEYINQFGKPLKT